MHACSLYFQNALEKRADITDNYVQHANNFNFLFRPNLPDRWLWKQHR